MSNFLALSDETAVSPSDVFMDGQSITEIRQAHDNNPYSLRTGTPIIDNQLRNDRIYLIGTALIPRKD